MRKAVAVKIAEHLAAIAAPARVKRALDRYVEKKAIALTDRPMAYGAGLGALGGGALMGGSTAIANMFRKKEDKKSVLDNALLGAAGGGADGVGLFERVGGGGGRGPGVAVGDCVGVFAEWGDPGADGGAEPG